MLQHSTTNRCRLWIDGVGTFLVLLDDEIVIGRTATSSRTEERDADIALMSNLSRRHASIKRVAEDYIVEAHSKTQVQGRVITDFAVLKSPTELVLNDSVRLRFELGSPLSASARLEVLSNHRSQVSINSIVLMADTCLLGPGPENHIRCPNWSSQMVLVRRGIGLVMKCRNGMTVNGTPHTGWVELQNGHLITENGIRWRFEYL